MAAETGLPVVVIKLGGDVLEGAALAQVAEQVQRVRHIRPVRMVLVHGGGQQATELAQRLGVATRIVAGRRQTDAAMLDVLKMALAGRLNVDLCAALRAAGVPAVGLHAGSAVIRATRRPPRVITGAGPDPVDLGLVGDVVGFDDALLDSLWRADRVPVLSCLGLDADGQVLNINADLAASQLAAAVRAEILVAVNAVGGVRRDKNDPNSRLARLTVSEAKAAITSGQVQGGMIPKLEEAFAPLAAGVRMVQIVAPPDLEAALARPGSAGTLLLAD